MTVEGGSESPAYGESSSGDSLNHEEWDPLFELSEITRSLRAYLEYSVASGTTGIPRDAEARARVLAEYQANGLGEPYPRQAGQEFVVGRASPTGAAVPLPAAPRSTAPGPSPQALPGASGPTAPSERGESGSKAALSVLRPAAWADIADLDSLAEQVRACRSCSLHVERTQTVFSRGTGSSGLCFIGEGPGADEDAQGEPFVGKAGQLLDQMIQAMGFSRDEVYVCNIVKCRPPNNRKPSPEEMVACSGFLERQIGLLRPRVLVALGATAVSGLLGIQEGITKVRGRFLLYQGRIPVMPTFHPAYLLRTPSAKREVWSDLKQVVQHMGRALPPRA